MKEDKKRHFIPSSYYESERDDFHDQERRVTRRVRDVHYFL